MLSKNQLCYFISFYVIILFGFSFFIIPTTDTYYYFTWSKSLQLSYVDGPPLIAYLLYITTHVFGNNFFAIEMLSLLSIYVSTFIIYKIITLYNSKSTALLASSLFLTFPFATTRFIAISMTLDGLEVMSSLLVIYMTMLWIKNRNTRYIYYTAISIGIALLSKYNTIVLILAIMIYCIYKANLRKIYCNINFYISIFIAVIIFSPVLIWNYQHHWVSFIYQLTSHKWNGDVNAINSSAKYGLKGVWFYLLSCVFGVLNIHLLLLFYIKFIKKIKIDYNIYNSLLIFSIYFILSFWLFQSYTSHIALNYLVSVSSIVIIIVTQQLVKLNNKKLIVFLLFIFTCYSITMLVDKSILHKKDIANYNKYVKSGMIDRF